jgi:hypothetical protein
MFKLWRRNRFLSLKNDVNVASKSNKKKNLFLVAILKGTGTEAGTARKEVPVRIRGFESVPKCHGSATLRNRYLNKSTRFHNTGDNSE